MSIDIKVPVLPESVADASVAKWHKKVGDAVKRDETIVDIETDKVVLEVPAAEDGVIEAIKEDEGATVTAEQVIGVLKAGAVAAESQANVEQAAANVNGTIIEKQAPNNAAANSAATDALSPSVRRLVAEHGLNPGAIQGSGKGGRVTKEDVDKHLKKSSKDNVVSMPTAVHGIREEQRVPMTRLRKRVAERLLNAQHQMAILTTFNEVDMKAVMDIRKQYKDQFEKTHGVRLGFMSFFIKACVAALKKYPDVNAYIEGDEIIYHGYCDVGVAVSTDRGLVVPVLRNAEKMSMADIEGTIADYAGKARNNKLTIEEMTGGTFSITNGGVFGSLLSTPILNPPQSAILGMHKIEQRAVVVDGEIVVRPMMYLALSYDHRIIDGSVSVGFLKTIKELLEDPARLILDV